MCGFIVWIAVVIGAWWAYFNSKSDTVNNPGGLGVWLVIAIAVTLLFVVPLALAILGKSRK